MIDGPQTVSSIIAMMPPGAMEAVTLGSQQPRQASYTAIAWANSRRKPAKNMELILAGAVIGEEWIKFQLYKVAESVNPKIGDTITDAAGDVWQVKNVNVKMMKLIFDCLCLKNK